MYYLSSSVNRRHLQGSERPRFILISKITHSHCDPSQMEGTQELSTFICKSQRKTKQTQTLMPIITPAEVFLKGSISKMILSCENRISPAHFTSFLSLSHLDDID